MRSCAPSLSEFLVTVFIVKPLLMLEQRVLSSFHHLWNGEIWYLKKCGKRLLRQKGRFP